MSVIKLLYPFLRRRTSNFLEYKHLGAYVISRHKSSKEFGVAKVRNVSEVDTNVKPLGEKVKEGTKTLTYLSIILLGISVTGTLFYAVFNELFSSQSPNNIYTKAVKKCLANTKIQDKLGTPIKAYGEETRRGRRQHPSYVGFLDNNGKKHIRMKFYLQGSFHKATAHLEMIENETGRYEYRYLLVQADDLLQTAFILEDNRDKQILTPETEFTL